MNFTGAKRKRSHGLKSPPQYKPMDRHWRLSLTVIWTTSFSWDSPCQDLSCSCPGHSMGWTRPALVPKTFSEHSSAQYRPSQAAHTTASLHSKLSQESPSTRCGVGNPSPHEHGCLTHWGQCDSRLSSSDSLTLVLLLITALSEGEL